MSIEGPQKRLLCRARPSLFEAMELSSEIQMQPLDRMTPSPGRPSRRRSALAAQTLAQCRREGREFLASPTRRAEFSAGDGIEGSTIGRSRGDDLASGIAGGSAQKRPR